MTPEDKEFIDRLYKAFIPEAPREDREMTPRERAKEATSEAGCPDWGSDDQEQLELAVEQAIIAAVEEEREACAQIADALLAERGSWYRMVSDAIRARGNKD